MAMQPLSQYEDVPTKNAMSILHGTSETPLVDLTLAQMLDFQCERYGMKECLVTPWTQARWTYEYLRQESIVLAKALVDRGIGHGDRIGIMAGNCEQYVAVFFACMRIGAILVILNNNYTASEAQYALRFTECRMLFTTPRIGQHDNRSLLYQLSEQPESVEEVVILRGYPGVFSSYTSLLEEGLHLPDQPVRQASRQVSKHDVCNLQFTSGTTGNPKASMLTHYSLVNNARFIGDRMALTDDDVLCCPPPLFHCFGLVLGMLAIVTHGGTIVYPSETFDPAACLQVISDERCTAIHGVPAMFDSIFSIERPKNFDCTRLRTGIIAGAPVPRHLMELLVEELGMVEFTSSYGLTEASPTVFNAQHSDTITLKLSTVGHLMPHAHAKIVDRDNHILPLGERGELCVAGYQLQAGYWNNEAKTNETMLRDEHGVLWLHTGDEAMFHPDGTCSITGRFKDIIIRGGENIYPLEIEERLTLHPSVDRAVVVGVQHAKYGEVPAAFLLLSARGRKHKPPTDDDVRAWVRAELGWHKAPEYVFWLGRGGVPRDVPLTGSGKVRKFELVAVAERLVRSGGRARL